MDKKEEIKLTLQPKYNILFNFLYKHAATFVIVLLILIVLIAQNELVEYGVAILVIYVLYLIANTIYNKIKAKNTVFNFYANRLEYNNKFRDKDLITINYKEITQVRYGQTFLQAVFKIGTIMIYTNDKKISRKWIFINGVKDVKMIYEKLINIIDGTTENK